MTTDSFIYDWMLDEEDVERLLEAIEMFERHGAKRVGTGAKAHIATMEETRKRFDGILRPKKTETSPSTRGIGTHTVSDTSITLPRH